MASNIAQSELRQICIALIEGLRDTSIAQASFLTFTSIRNIIGQEFTFEQTLYAVNWLANDEIGFLKRTFFFSDGVFEGELEDSDIEEAVAVGGLTHPETGEFIKDYLQYVFPVFSLISDGAKAA